MHALFLFSHDRCIVYLRARSSVSLRACLRISTRNYHQTACWLVEMIPNTTNQHTHMWVTSIQGVGWWWWCWVVVMVVFCSVLVWCRFSHVVPVWLILLFTRNEYNLSLFFLGEFGGTRRPSAWWLWSDDTSAFAFSVLHVSSFLLLLFIDTRSRASTLYFCPMIANKPHTIETLAFPSSSYCCYSMLTMPSCFVYKCLELFFSRMPIVVVRLPISIWAKALTMFVGLFSLRFSYHK